MFATDPCEPNHPCPDRRPSTRPGCGYGDNSCKAGAWRIDLYARYVTRGGQYVSEGPVLAFAGALGTMHAQVASYRDCVGRVLCLGESKPGPANAIFPVRAHCMRDHHARTLPHHPLSALPVAHKVRSHKKAACCSSRRCAPLVGAHPVREREHATEVGQTDGRGVSQTRSLNERIAPLVRSTRRLPSGAIRRRSGSHPGSRWCGRVRGVRTCVRGRG